MGPPAYPSKRQMDILTKCSNPQIITKQIEIKDGYALLDFNLNSNAVCYFELQSVEPQTDRGYRTERIQGA